MSKSVLPAIAIMASMILAGCATTVTPTSEAAQGTVLNGFGKSAPGTVPVVLKRDNGLMGGACSHGLYVDGAAVANLRAGQLVTVYLRPGPHIIGARPNGICGGGDAEVEITVREGRSNSVRVGSDQSGSLRIQPTAF